MQPPQPPWGAAAATPSPRPSRRACPAPPRCRPGLHPPLLQLLFASSGSISFVLRPAQGIPALRAEPAGLGRAGPGCQLTCPAGSSSGTGLGSVQRQQIPVQAPAAPLLPWPLGLGTGVGEEGMVAAAGGFNSPCTNPDSTASAQTEISALEWVFLLGAGRKGEGVEAGGCTPGEVACEPGCSGRAAGVR